MSQGGAVFLSVPLDGTVMDCVRFGRGSRPMALIPGLGLRSVRDTGYSLARMYRQLGEARTVYVLDRKQQTPEGCTIADLAADTARAMDALHILKADVLGVSQGGMIAQYLALDRPELVGKLVLAVTLSRPNGAIRQAVETWTALARQKDYEALVRDVLARTYSKDYAARFGALLTKLFLARLPSLERFTALAGACLTCDTYDRLDRIRCPAFVIGGREDRIVTARASEEMAERMGCALYMYEGLGHSAYEEAPDFSGRVLRFLDD